MKIKINKQEWTVEVISSHDPKLVAEGQVCLGCTWSAQYSIYVSNEIPLALRYKVLIHEITHAYMYMTQVNIPEHLDEEYLCNFIEDFGEEILNDANRVHFELLKEYPGI